MYVIKKSSEVWEGGRSRFVCFRLTFAWQGLSPSISRLWAAQRDKKYTSPSPPSLLVHGKGRSIWILSWRGVGRIKKISVFFFSRMTNKVDVSFSRTDSNSGVEAQKTILYQLLKSPNSSDCSNLRSRGSTSLFVLEARGKGRLIYLLYAAFFLPLFPSTDFRAIPEKKKPDRRSGQDWTCIFTFVNTLQFVLSWENVYRPPIIFIA